MNCVNEATWPIFCVKMKKDLQYWYNYDNPLAELN